MSKGKKETIYTEVGLTGHEPHAYIVKKYNQNKDAIDKDPLKKIIFEDILLKPEARREYDVANGVNLEKIDMSKAQSHQGVQNNPLFIKMALQANAAEALVLAARGPQTTGPKVRS